MKSLTKIIMVIVVALTVAFVPKPGGEGFEIFLNNKAIVQQFGTDMKAVKSLELSSMTAQDRLTIKYHHCGRNGKQRIVSIRNREGQLLKSFTYPDTKSITTMEVPLVDILKLKDQTLQLYYSSSELVAPRLLVSFKKDSRIASK